MGRYCGCYSIYGILQDGTVIRGGTVIIVGTFIRGGSVIRLWKFWRLILVLLGVILLGTLKYNLIEDMNISISVD